MHRPFLFRTVVLGCVTLFALAACSPPTPSATPTIAVEMLATPTSLPTPSLTPSFTSVAAQLVAPTETATPAPPTDTASPQPTQGPVEYVIQPGDTLLFIIQQPPFNYRDFGVLPEILRLNPTMPDIDRLPPPGTTILIPLPTATSTPEGFALTPTAPQVNLPVNTTILGHEVREGETILGIAEQYRTTLRILNDLNPDLVFLNCDFSIPSGGENCSVLIGVGTPIFVPAPTATPTLSPTPSGLETATPTPTFMAPFVSFPPRDAVIQGASSFAVQWVGVGVLESQQVYLVQVENLTTGAAFNDITRSNLYRLPSSLAPTGSEPQEYRWRVSVAQQNAQGLYDFVGASGEWRPFTWRPG